MRVFDCRICYGGENATARLTDHQPFDADLGAVASLIDKIYPVEEAGIAYEDLKSLNKRPMIAILEYSKENLPDKKILLSNYKLKADTIKVGIIGAGTFAQEIHLPNLEKLHVPLQLSYD